eukprot:2317462-Rhodomonas_salina.1
MPIQPSAPAKMKRSWTAVISMALPGLALSAPSTLKRCMPKKKAWSSPTRSAGFGSPSHKHRNPAPSTASPAATQERAVRMTPAKRTSRNGHTTQLIEAKKDATPALVPPAMQRICVA